LHLGKEHSLRAEDIAEIICTVPPGQVKRNFEPEQVKYSPPNGYAAISSIPYMVGAALVEGRLTLKEVSDEKVGDPQILALARKVKWAVDDAYRDYQNAAVEIHMQDGRSFRREQTDAIGSPEIPAPRELIEGKFRANAGYGKASRNADRIIAVVSRLEDCDDINELTALLRTTT
jgi:2-methylcitrate dehydratase PrpD